MQRHSWRWRLVCPVKRAPERSEEGDRQGMTSRQAESGRREGHAVMAALQSVTYRQLLEVGQCRCMR